VFRYRDRDHHLLGMAADGFLKSMRGPEANIWEMLEQEVFLPIGIEHAPIVKTQEAAGVKGLPWFHAGFYPSLDDIVKIGILYQNHGRLGQTQILHAGVIAQIFSTDGALIKSHDHSLETAFATGPVDATARAGKQLYKMGFHYLPYINKQGIEDHLPVMAGFSGTQAIFLSHVESLQFALPRPGHYLKTNKPICILITA